MTRAKTVPGTIPRGDIPEPEQDKRLGETLVAEWPGILNWALAGCLAWQNEGLPASDEVEHATRAYREQEDPLAEFLAERCCLEAQAWVSRQELYHAYTSWAETAGEKYPLSPRRFYDRVRRREGVGENRRREGSDIQRGFQGLCLQTVPGR